MSRIETIRSIEASLQRCQDQAVAVGDEVLAYFIGMAISEARGSGAADEGFLPELNVADYPRCDPGVRLASLKTTQ